MKKKLKPCPFCGKKAEIRYSRPFTYVFCSNTECPRHTCIRVCDYYEECDSRPEAIKQWNELEVENNE